MTAAILDFTVVMKNNRYRSIMQYANFQTGMQISCKTLHYNEKSVILFIDITDLKKKEYFVFFITL